MELMSTERKLAMMEERQAQQPVRIKMSQKLNTSELAADLPLQALMTAENNNTDHENVNEDHERAQQITPYNDTSCCNSP